MKQIYLICSNVARGDMEEVDFEVGYFEDYNKAVKLCEYRNSLVKRDNADLIYYVKPILKEEYIN